VPAAALAELARALDAPVSYFFDAVGSRGQEQSDDNVIDFPVDNPRAPRELTLAEHDLLRSFRAISTPQDRELLLQMAERLAGK
jgi:urease accessory protein UreE